MAGIRKLPVKEGLPFHGDEGLFFCHLIWTCRCSVSSLNPPGMSHCRKHQGGAFPDNRRRQDCLTKTKGWQYESKQKMLQIKKGVRTCAEICLFVGFRLIREFPVIWTRHHYRRRASNFDLQVNSALMASEQWGFFSVSHLLETWDIRLICMVKSKDPWNSHLSPSVWHWSRLPVLTIDLGLSPPEIEPRSPTC